MIFYNEYGQEMVFDHAMQEIMSTYLLNIPISEIESFRGKYIVVKDTAAFDAFNDVLQQDRTSTNTIPRIVNSKISPNYIERVINGVTNKVNEFLDELIIKLEYDSILDAHTKQISTSESISDNSRYNPIELTRDSFQGIMKVFISHKFENENQQLARVLRKVLRDKKIEGYLAENTKEYELLIGDKIRKAIDNSDFVVGIITKESEQSSSVNQELGYAFGRGIPVVIMIEKDVSPGVLTHGRETEEFTRQNFDKHCYNVVEYVLEKGVTKRKFTSINSGDYDIVMDKFTEAGIHYVGIRNAKGKTIKSCTVSCEYHKCEWWNTHDTVPRNIMEGEAANIILPRGFANTNPIIIIKSNDEVLLQLRLSEIAHRMGVKWNANDENIELVERLNTSLNRVRSNLATLYSIFQGFMEYPKNVSVSEELRLSMLQKNKIVEDTQTVVNQASHILEVDWIHQLNDLCRLAKDNPGIFGDRLQTIQCDNCVGIISQIDVLLKYIPNPPL